MTDASMAVGLSGALRQYLEARSAALVVARRVLGITEMDARALLFIVDHPGTRPTALADYLGITSAGVTTLVDRLITRHVVRRDVDPADRRVNRITPTIDIAAAPWSELRRFDEDIDRAVTGKDQNVTDEFAILLTEITAAAGSRA